MGFLLKSWETLRDWPRAVTWAGIVLQVLGSATDYGWSWILTLLGVLVCGLGLYHFHRAKGHPDRYALAGTALAAFPVAGPVIGLLLRPSAGGNQVSYGSWGFVLLFLALMWSIAPARETQAFALGCLLAAGFSFAAWAAQRAGRAVLAGVLFVSSFGGCAVGAGLGVIADPRTFRRSNEAVGLANLGAMRSALSLYHDDNKTYPATLEALTVRGRYLFRLHEAKTQVYHPDSAAVHLGSAPADSGGWLYDPATGEVRVDCTHTDTRGRAWDSY